MVKRLTILVLEHKGTRCHLCDFEGADSADHNPPRQDLLEAGVVNPDQLRYLWPAHRLCNIRRKRRPITAQLKAELTARRLEDLRIERATAAAVRSSRFTASPPSSSAAKAPTGASATTTPAPATAAPPVTSGSTPAAPPTPSTTSSEPRTS